MTEAAGGAMAFEQNVTADLIHVCGLPAVPDLVLA